MKTNDEIYEGLKSIMSYLKLVLPLQEPKQPLAAKGEQPCNNCGGSGRAPAQNYEEDIKCPKCNGSGITKIEFNDCNTRHNYRRADGCWNCANAKIDTFRKEIGECLRGITPYENEKLAYIICDHICDLHEKGR